ncbi:MAG: hypothetical protein AAF378_14555, partial [Cyanobacteria bacterium P01_A01_bin.84]
QLADGSRIGTDISGVLASGVQLASQPAAESPTERELNRRAVLAADAAAADLPMRSLVSTRLLRHHAVLF